jgi:DNA helicase-2/ATP-dependent DNA helicase PcrA
MMSCVDGYIPAFQSLGERDQIEEERRLLYVALTRAKNNLFIVKPHLDLSQSNYYRYSGVQFSKLSRFLSDEESLSHFIEQWTLDDDTLLPVKDDQCEDDTTNAQDAPDTSRRKYSF